MTSTEPAVQTPAGAEPDIWEGHPLHGVVFTIPDVVLNNTGDHPLRSPIVTAQAIQWADSSLDVDGVIEHHRSVSSAPTSPGSPSARPASSRAASSRPPTCSTGG